MKRSSERWTTKPQAPYAHETGSINMLQGTGLIDEAIRRIDRKAANGVCRRLNRNTDSSRHVCRWWSRRPWWPPLAQLFTLLKTVWIVGRTTCAAILPTTCGSWTTPGALGEPDQQSGFTARPGAVRLSR